MQWKVHQTYHFYYNLLHLREAFKKKRKCGFFQLQLCFINERFFKVGIQTLFILLQVSLFSQETLKHLHLHLSSSIYFAKNIKIWRSYVRVFCRQRDSWSLNDLRSLIPQISYLPDLCNLIFWISDPWYLSSKRSLLYKIFDLWDLSDLKSLISKILVSSTKSNSIFVIR